MPDSEAQAIRISAVPGDADDEAPRGVQIRRVVVRQLGFGESNNTMFRAVAAESQRGMFPRAFLGEQSYWTVVGRPGESYEALIGEDGAIELLQGGPSIEPALMIENELITWADVDLSHTLADGALPLPGVRWSRPGLTLDITAFVPEPHAGSQPSDASTRGVSGIYTLTNTGATTMRGTLALMLRPFQVLPLTQELNMIGGAARLDMIGASDQGFLARAGRAWVGVALASPPDTIDLSHHAADDVLVRFARGTSRRADLVTDRAGLASASGLYDFELEPGAAMDYAFATFMGPEGRPPELPAAATINTDSLRTARDASLAAWRSTLEGVRFRLPISQQRWADTFRATVAYILINQDGPAIQPGSRSYDRTWIRDGALTSTALLYAGRHEPVRAFIDWFGPYQYENGKVPCCVDERGPDPVPEHDSHGQYIYAVAEYDRFMRDDVFLRAHLPRVAKAVDYIEFLRAQRMTEAYHDAAGIERAKFGLVPESISHEGYSAKPMHSYWDNFWALQGLEDAAVIARRVNDSALEARATAAAESLRQSLYDSMRLAAQVKNVNYIPGCVELGDFDATSTSIGVFPIGELGSIPEPQLTSTFDRYEGWFIDRLEGRLNWRDYTPYEIRNTTTFLFLNRRQTTHRMMDFFFADQRPAGWHAWAEVVRNGYRTPGFIGDIPHTWVASDFVKLLRTMFVHEDEHEPGLVVGMGIPDAWFSPEPVEASGLPTHFGVLDVAISMRDGARVVRLDGRLHTPPAFVEIALEYREGSRAEADGKPAAITSDGRIRLPWPVREVVIRGE